MIKVVWCHVCSGWLRYVFWNEGVVFCSININLVSKLVFFPPYKDKLSICPHRIIESSIYPSWSSIYPSYLVNRQKNWGWMMSNNIDFLLTKRLVLVWYYGGFSCFHKSLLCSFRISTSNLTRDMIFAVQKLIQTHA